jgi:hypothetical protein
METFGEIAIPCNTGAKVVHGDLRIKRFTIPTITPPLP